MPWWDRDHRPYGTSAPAIKIHRAGQIVPLGEEATEALLNQQDRDQGCAQEGGSMERFVQSRIVCSLHVASRYGEPLSRGLPVALIKQALE